MTNQAKLGEPRSRLVIHDLAQRNGHAEFSQDIREGLSSSPKHLFPKYLYDELGSRLFEAICEVDEYYLTRAEDEILKTHADEIVAGIPNCDTLIELGSGSAEKTRTIIDAFMKQRQELLLFRGHLGVSARRKVRTPCSTHIQGCELTRMPPITFRPSTALPPLGPHPVLVLPRIEHRQLRAC